MLNCQPTRVLGGSVALLLCCSHTLGPSPSPSQFESKDETDDGSDTDTTRQLLIDLASPSHRLDTTGQDSIMAGPRMSGYEAASPDLATASTSLLPIAPIKPTPLHPLEEDPPLVLQHTRSSTQSFVADRRQTPDDEPQNGMCRLPKRAPDEDAQAARDKLDRIAKAQQAKHNWAKSTGITIAAKAFGRHDRRMRRRAHGASSDDDSSDSALDDDEARGHIGEVKLMITGNPVVTKVFDAASRAKGRLRAQTESPDASPHKEESHFRFSIGRPGSSLAKRLRGPSITPASEAFSTPAPSPTSEAPRLPSIDAPTTPTVDRPRSRIRPNLGPELLVVDEEGHQHQATQDSEHKRSNRPNLPLSNSFNSQSPSSLIWSAPSSPGNRPPLDQRKQPHSSASSFIGGPIHDEPDTHEPEGDLTARTLASPAPSSSASSVSSDDELGDSALASDSDDGQDNMLKIQSLSLEHGETLTKEQLKRRKKLIRREIRRRKANGEPLDDLAQMQGKAGQLGNLVSSRVSKGLHYASSQSRNRRAMDRYSPHPMQLALHTSDLPRSTSAQSAGFDRTNTPFSAIAPSISRGSNAFSQRRESVATMASSRRSSMTGGEDDDLQDPDAAGPTRRFSGVDRSILSSRNSIRKYLHAPNVLKRHRRKKWEAEMDAFERAAEAEANKADPDAELDQMLAKHAQQQAPSDAGKVKYEFDVLYENQRGLLVFGIPKFSPRTLFQWDPSPWTAANGKRSPYNIANAQLPDPSWEWAYHEWYIDMTGDVDEAGWQYSGNFGRRFWPNVHFPHGRVGLPKTGVEGIKEMNARLAEKERKRTEKEEQKEDGGFEALKRTARARSSKWTGSPDAWTFVRRRRWIRLRRRKPLFGAHAGKTPTTEGQEKAASPAQELGLPDLGGKAPLSPGKMGVKPGPSDDENIGESPLGGSDESDLSSSEDDEALYAPAFGGSSGFLPRRLPGGLSNGADPTKAKDPLQRRRARKHAREFTGTIRELKSLLPSIVAMDRKAGTRGPTGLTASASSYKWAMLKINRVDARNPFISWHFVKHRLQDEDMAFAASTLRTMERKYQQRQLAAVRKKDEAQSDVGATSSHPPIPSKLLDSSRSIRFGDGEPCTGLKAGNDETSRPATLGLQEPFAQSPAEGHELTREALVEINFARVLRVLRACKVDRQRMDLWKLWLGVITLDSLMETVRREDLVALGLVVPVEAGTEAGMPEAASPSLLEAAHASGGSSFRYRQRAEKARARWRSAVPKPDASDVWDVLERKLDEVLLLFEFQSNRAQLIRLLLTVHEQLHPDHVYRDRSLRANPVELSPAHVHGDAAEMGGPEVGGAFGSRLGGWKRAGVPRLEFFSDLQRILAALPGNDATTNSQYILSQPSPSDEIVAMPMGIHTNPLIDKLEAEAESDAFLEGEHIPSASPPEMMGEGRTERLQAREAARLAVPRTPSPLARAPSVPLPYRNSPLSPPVVPESQTTASSRPESTASAQERAPAPGSAELTPASSSPDADAAGQREHVGKTVTAVEPHIGTRPGSRPRPPIPVRSGSVSPVKQREPL